MADTKQPQLNGAYYGPPIPPPARSYHRPGRGSDCGCCLLCTLFKFILSIVIIIGIIVLVLWLVLRPNKVKVYVTGATLSGFNLTGTNMLNYNLTMDVMVRNPNKKVGIYYDWIETRAFYDGERFGYYALPTFYQGHKNTTMLYPIFDGQNLVVGSDTQGRFNTEKNDGFYNIDVNIYARVRFKVWWFKSNKYSPKAKCHLRLPLGAASNGFTETKCDVDI
ncbi:hypothetical protein QJS10_CPB19g00462 [Acorus calamus]|uniref:Late embryogenesis abundant protein LEA-2 subgroup domain-containing protein n=1 Tax=Acorus calamus TaxID=4465 RepID=A0AAV9CEN8_ACOCL|nr:hypothetical protein QJS10_CPB19g00462 [Acorus calamus]